MSRPTRKHNRRRFVPSWEYVKPGTPFVVWAYWGTRRVVYATADSRIIAQKLADCANVNGYHPAEVEEREIE